MKIAVVLGSLNPGGAETQTIRKVARLRARGWDVRVILPNGPGEMPGNLGPLAAREGIPVTSLASHEVKVPAIRRTLAELKPDVVDAVGYPATLWAALAAKQAGVPHRIVRFESCGYIRDEMPEGRALEQRGHAAATALVGNSQAVLDSLDRYDGVDGIPRYLIHNGVEVPTLPDYQPERDTVVIGYLANFRADGLKNQLLLVRAAAWLVKAGVTNFRLEMAGYDSPYQRAVEEDVRRLGLDAYVRFPGQIDLGRLANWDIAVNCSRTEGLSNAVLEGMAYRLPTVATAVGGNPELVAHGATGLLVEDNQELPLVVALIRLIQDQPLRLQWGANARARVEREFTWERILERWEALYRRELGPA